MTNLGKIAKGTIDIFRPERDSLEEITALLHRSYQPLIEMGLNYVAATQSSVITAARLAEGIGYIARSENEIIGTITYYSSVKEDHSHPSFYKKAEVCHFGQFAVSPDLQGKGIGRMLLEHVEVKALEDKMGQIACDTAEGSADLIAFYKRRGYSQIGYQQWSHAVYRSVILCKDLNPLALRKCASLGT